MSEPLGDSDDHKAHSQNISGSRGKKNMLKKCKREDTKVVLEEVSGHQVQWEVSTQDL